jgi:hypothetical protein
MHANSEQRFGKIHNVPTTAIACLARVVGGIHGVIDGLDIGWVESKSIHLADQMRKAGSTRLPAHKISRQEVSLLGNCHEGSSQR